MNLISADVTSSWKSAGILLSGIGFFFIGFRLLSRNMKELYSRKLRLWLAAVTQNRMRSSILGIISGVLTQSAPSVTFIHAGISEANLINVKNILPAIFWTNVGCSLIVWWSSLNFSAVVYYLIGILGIISAFVINRKYKTVTDSLLGIAFIFYGIYILKSGAIALNSIPFISKIIIICSGSFILSFIAGVLCAAIAQSSIAVTIVALSLLHAGLFPLNQLVIMVYGTMLGVSILVLILSLKLKGSSKQVAMSQVLFDFGGVVFFTILFVIEYLSGIPLIIALVRKTGTNQTAQIAHLYILFNVVTAVMLTLVSSYIYRFLIFCFPETELERLAQIRYIKNIKGFDIGTKIDLSIKEQNCLTEHFLSYFVYARNIIASNIKEDWDTLRRPSLQIITEISGLIDELSGQPVFGDDSVRLIRLIRRQELWKVIESELPGFLQKNVQAHHNSELRDLASNMMESAEAVLGVMNDAVVSLNVEDITNLLLTTSDKSEILSKLRESFAKKVVSGEQRLILTDLTVHFERLIWNVNRLAQTMK